LLDRVILPAPNWQGDPDNVFLAHPNGINEEIFNLNLTTVAVAKL
jgi:hypothetical protein